MGLAALNSGRDGIPEQHREVAGTDGCFELKRSRTRGPIFG
jgi:hypothetical protein